MLYLQGLYSGHFQFNSSSSGHICSCFTPNGFAVGDLGSHVVRVWVTHVDTSDAFLGDQLELDF